MADSSAGKTIVALIPAKAHSRRIPGKNTRALGQHPLLAYAVSAARQAGIFTDVMVSTDHSAVANMARHYGASVHLRTTDDRPVADDEPDIAWVRSALLSCRPTPDAFMILRCTTPFRTATDLTSAWQAFLKEQPCDSMRAVRPIREHPGKMWVLHRAILPKIDPTDTRGVIGSASFREHMTPLFPFVRPWDPTLPSHPLYVPWHSHPTERLPELWIQTAGLEVAWTYNVLPPSLTVAGTSEWQGTISGTLVKPICCDVGDPFGLDLNYESDWVTAQTKLDSGEWTLPPVPQEPYPADDLDVWSFEPEEFKDA